MKSTLEHPLPSKEHADSDETSRDLGDAALEAMMKDLHEAQWHAFDDMQALAEKDYTVEQFKDVEEVADWLLAAQQSLTDGDKSLEHPGGPYRSPGVETTRPSYNKHANKRFEMLAETGISGFLDEHKTRKDPRGLDLYEPPYFRDTVEGRLTVTDEFGGKYTVRLGAKFIKDKKNLPKHFHITISYDTEHKPEIGDEFKISLPEVEAYIGSDDKKAGKRKEEEFLRVASELRAVIERILQDKMPDALEGIDSHMDYNESHFGKKKYDK